MLTMQGSYAEALDSLKKSYALRPTREAVVTVGIIYYLEHDFDAAINAWNRVLDASPRSCEVYANIGMAYVRKGELEHACDAFKKTVRYSPNSSLGYYGLGLAHYFAGDFVAAREEAQRAEAIDRYPPVVLLLSELDVLQGDLPEAKRRIKEYYSLQHKHTAARSMTDMGFTTSEDFRWDPFVADNFDNGYLLLSREEQNAGRKESLNKQGHLQHLIHEAENELSETSVVDSDNMQKTMTSKGSNHGVLATGISHELNGDLYITHQLGLLKLSQGDYSSAARYFQSVIAQSDECNVDRLYLARAFALDGKEAQSSVSTAEFQERRPNQRVSFTVTGTTK